MMSVMLQKMMVAFGRRGTACPIDQTLGDAYKALEIYHEQYPAVFTNAAEILLAEVEGGAISLADVPRRLGLIVQMLDRLHRQEELHDWSNDTVVVAV